MKSKEYTAWKNMKSRCNSPSNAHKNYQVKKITVCDRWINSFENFLSDLGKCPTKDYSLDRINNDGNYEPSNCRWASKKEQSINRGDFNKIYDYNGQSLTLKEWSEQLNLDYNNLHKRIFRSNMSFDKAISYEYLYEYNGVKKHLKDWALNFNFKPETLYSRISKGWSINECLETPFGKRRVKNTI